MQLSMWSSYFINEKPEDMVLHFLKHGFRCTEISFEHSINLLDRGTPETVGRDFRKFMDDHGFSTPQGHLKFPELDLATPDEKLRRASLDWWKHELVLFEAIGVERAVLHPGGTQAFQAGEKTMAEIDAIRLDSLRELTDFTKNMKVRVCLENMACGRYMSTAESLLGVLDALGAENIGICLDTGHLNIQMRQGHGDFIRRCGKRLQALHIADNNGGSDEHLLPFGGTVNWEETVAALKEIGYDRVVNFEVPGEAWRMCRGVPELLDARLDFALLLGNHLFSGLN